MLAWYRAFEKWLNSPSGPFWIWFQRLLMGAVVVVLAQFLWFAIWCTFHSDCAVP